MMRCLSLLVSSPSSKLIESVQLAHLFLKVVLECNVHLRGPPDLSTSQSHLYDNYYAFKAIWIITMQMSLMAHLSISCWRKLFVIGYWLNEYALQWLITNLCRWIKDPLLSCFLLVCDYGLSKVVANGGNHPIKQWIQPEFNLGEYMMVKNAINSAIYDSILIPVQHICKAHQSQHILHPCCTYPQPPWWVSLLHLLWIWA